MAHVQSVQTFSLGFFYSFLTVKKILSIFCRISRLFHFAVNFCAAGQLRARVEKDIMDSSSMSGMDGMEGMSMDMGSDGMFRPVNQKIARSYWYIVAALFAFALLLKGLGAIESWSRLVLYPPRRPWALVMSHMH